MHIEKCKIKRKYRLEVLRISAQSSAASGCTVGHFLLPPLLLHRLRRHRRRRLHRRHPRDLPPPLPPHHGNLSMKSAVIAREIRILQIHAVKRINPKPSRQLTPDFYVEADDDAASFCIILL